MCQGGGRQTESEGPVVMRLWCAREEEGRRRVKALM